MLDYVKRNEMRMQLSSVECRMSILEVHQRPVQTKYALVELLHISSTAIHFSTPLRLPAGHELKYCFQFLMKEHAFKLIGTDMRQLSEDSPFDYAVDYDIDPVERVDLYAAINETMESAPTFTSRAIACYASSHTYEQFNPRKVFQTY